MTEFYVATWLVNKYRKTFQRVDDLYVLQLILKEWNIQMILYLSSETTSSNLSITSISRILVSSSSTK